MPTIQDTIARIAGEEGVDPAFALSVAERESNFKPNARASKSIHGLFQMSGELRRKYGIGDSTDPEVQTRGWMRFQRDLRRDMATHMGRDPTDQETYLGHYWGARRAGRLLAGDQTMAPADVFSPLELRLNPEIARAQSVGPLAQRIMGDIDRRRQRFNMGPPADAAPIQPDQAGIPQPAPAATPEPRASNEPAFNAPPAPRGRSGDLNLGATRDLSEFGRHESEIKMADLSEYGRHESELAKPAIDLKVNNRGKNQGNQVTAPGQEVDLSLMLGPPQAPPATLGSF